VDEQYAGCPDPVDSDPVAVDAEGADDAGGRIEERAQRDPLFEDSVGRPEEKDRGPPLAPANHRLSHQKNPGAVERQVHAQLEQKLDRVQDQGVEWARGRKVLRNPRAQKQ
jgi:hypothetical protein